MPIFYRDNARWLFGGFLLAFFSCFGQTFFISIWGAEIRSAYGLTDGGFGLVYMAGTLASAATLPFIGKLVDHVAIAKCAALVVALLALACIFMALGSGLPVLLLTIYLLRLFGQGMMIHVGITAMGRWYSVNRGKAVAAAMIGINFAEGLTPSIFVFLAAIIGWRQSWLAAAGTLLVLALPTIYLLMRKEREPQSLEMDATDFERNRQWTRREMLRDQMFWLSAMGVFAPSFIGTSIFFHQDYLIEINGWEPSFYYSSFALMALTTIIVALLTGLAIDRWTAVQIMPWFMLPLGVGCILLGSVSHPFVIVVFMMLLGCSYGITSTMFGALWPEIYGTKHLGSLRSIVVALMVLLTAAGPGVTGVLIDAGIPFYTQLVWLGAYCLLTMIVLRYTSRKIIARLTRWATV